MSASGCFLPRGLTFGPTNGPEDFQELVFKVFQKELYQSWFLFVDDLCVATGRPRCHPDGPSQAHDVCVSIREETEEERSAQGRTVKAGKSCREPFAHWCKIVLIFKIWIWGIADFNRGGYKVFFEDHCSVQWESCCEPEAYSSRIAEYSGGFKKGISRTKKRWFQNDKIDTSNI